MIDIDQFAGSDDAKLDAALSQSLNIHLPERSLFFAKKGRPIPKGLSITGSGRYGPVLLGFDSSDGVGWFHATGGTVKRTRFANLQVLGSGKSCVITQDASSSFQQLVIRSLVASGHRSVLGTRQQRLLVTASQFVGDDWDINNSSDIAILLGGSDNVFWPEGLLLDSPASLAPAPATPHLWISYMDKSTFGRLYITAEGNWQALEYSGQAYNSGSTGGNGGPCVFSGGVFEGRNSTHLCNGSVVQVSGGQPIFDNCWFGYASGASGVIDVEGGYTRLLNPTYSQGLGVAEDFPLVFAYGATTKVDARGGGVGSQGGRWVKPYPRLRSAGGAQIACDSSFIVS